MGLDAKRGIITAKFEPVIPAQLKIGNMAVLTDGFCDAIAVQFNSKLVPTIDKRAIAYSEDVVSEYADPDAWARIMRLPKGWLVDLSHQEYLDEANRLLRPLPIQPDIDDRNPHITRAIGALLSPMQYSAARIFLANQYGYNIGDNILTDDYGDIEGRFITND